MSEVFLNAKNLSPLKVYFFWLLLVTFVLVRLYFYFKFKPSFPDGTKIRISGRLSSEPMRYSENQVVNLGGFKVFLPLYPEIYYGDNLVVEGIVKDQELRNSKVIRIEESKLSLFSLREKLISTYQSSLPSPHSSLIAGMVLGSKSEIPQDFWEALRNTGTAHVIVASGMNVSLVAKFLILVLVLFLPRKKAIPFALFGIFTYCLLVGLEAPIIRAFIMGSLTFIAQEVGRLVNSGRILIFSALIMLLIWPSMVFDLGFYLSFAATSSILVLESRFRRYLGFLPAFIREDFSTTFAAQVGVTPILFWSFGRFNLLSPLINTAVLWTVVPITLLGMVGGMLGLISETLGKLVLWLLYPLTRWFIGIVSVMSKL